MKTKTLTTTKTQRSDVLSLRLTFTPDEAALIRSGAQLDKRTLRNFAIAHVVKMAKKLIQEDAEGQRMIVYRAIESGAQTSEDVWKMTGLDKVLITLCLSELEAINSLYSTTGKGNRSTLYYLTEKRKPREAVRAEKDDW